MNEKSISINFPDKIIFLLRIPSFHIKQQSAVHDDVLFKKKSNSLRLQYYERNHSGHFYQ